MFVFFCIVISLLLLIFIIYAIIPFVVTRIMKLGSIHQLDNGSRDISLTFDDGPHPVYTPMFLDLFSKHSIKVTFFVVGSEAEKYPDIIKRMHDEGHLIGIHNYRHTCNWFLSPKKLKEHIEQTAKVIKNITNIEPLFYRPPWGLVALPTLFQNKYRIILWSVMANDWSSKNGSEGIKSLLTKHTKPGSIILLHDNGDTPGADEDAPTHTLEALKSFILYCKENNYQFVRVDEGIKKREL